MFMYINQKIYCLVSQNISIHLCIFVTKVMSLQAKDTGEMTGIIDKVLGTCMYVHMCALCACGVSTDI